MNNSELYKLIEDCWSYAQGLSEKTKQAIIAKSIPILWFGDMLQYFESDLRIVTIAINPSKVEFPKSDSLNQDRFPDASHLNYKNKITPSDFVCYEKAMNNYFKTRPYTSWFAHYEKVINFLDASYWSHNVFKNTAIHLDLWSPMATKETWSNTGKGEKTQLINNEQYNNIFDRLLKLLKPHVIITSVCKRDACKRLAIAFPMLKTFDEFKHESTRKSIKYHHHGDNTKPYYLLGCNMRGAPFGGWQYDKLQKLMKTVKDDINQIKYSRYIDICFNTDEQ